MSSEYLNLESPVKEKEADDEKVESEKEEADLVRDDEAVKKEEEEEESEEEGEGSGSKRGKEKEVGVSNGFIKHCALLVCFDWADHFRNGYLLESTLVWADGRSEWQPLSAIPELMSRISGAEVSYPPVGASGMRNGSNAGTKPGKEDITASASIEDEFEKWQREIKKAEAEAERLKNGSTSGSFGAEVVEQAFFTTRGRRGVHR